MDMAKVNIRKIRKIYGICMAVYSGIVGLLFIIQVWSIFRSVPDNPYTVARITAAFSKIAVPVWIWVAAMVAGAFIPKAEIEKPKAYISSQLQLERLYKRVNVTEEMAAKIQPLKTLRIAFACAQVVVWAAVMIAGVCLLTAKGYQPKFDIAFFKEHNGLVDRIVCILPWLFSGLAVSVAATILAENSRKKEIAVLKESLASKAKVAEKTYEKQVGETCPIKRVCAKCAFLNTPKAVMITRICLGVIGVVFVVFGIFNGGMTDVLEKAVKICTQCIGLG